MTDHTGMTAKEAMSWMDMMIDRYEDIFGATKDSVCYRALVLALAALREMEPRVLAIGELVNSAFPIVVWTEERNDPGRGPYVEIATKSYVEANVRFIAFINEENSDDYASLALYSNTWRCWTRKPTPAQMAATAWEGREGEE